MAHSQRSNEKPKEIIALDWEETLVSIHTFQNGTSHSYFYEDALDLLTFLKEHDYTVIITSETAQFKQVCNLLKQHQLDSFIPQENIYVSGSPALNALGSKFKQGDYSKLDILDAQQQARGLSKDAYLMIDNNAEDLSLIQQAGYHTLLREHESTGYLTPVDSLLKEKVQALLDPLEDLIKEIKAQIARLRKSLFGGNGKATRIENALQRAQKQNKTYHSLDEFLDTRVEGQESLRDAISHHRIGLFGQSRSQIHVDSKVAAHNNRASFRKNK